MKSKIKYTEEPMGELKIVKDFLPPPDQLVLKEENVKITISLKKSSIAFFKEQAKKHKTSGFGLPAAGGIARHLGATTASIRRAVQKG